MYKRQVVDVKVTLWDGSYHEVDSSEMAFSIAGSMAFKDAMRKADPIITEPILKVAVIVPDEYLGDVIGDLTARRGQIQGMEAMAGTQRVNPESEFAWIPSSVEFMLIVKPEIFISLSALIPLVE